MNDEQLKEILQRLAYSVMANQLVCERLLNEKCSVSWDEIGAKNKEVDAHLRTNTVWQENRFPGLFS